MTKVTDSQVDTLCRRRPAAMPTSLPASYGRYGYSYHSTPNLSISETELLVSRVSRQNDQRGLLRLGLVLWVPRNMIDSFFLCLA